MLLTYFVQFRRFISVGAAGFLIEALILQILVVYLDVEAFTALIIAFAVAVTLTWALNRTYTFKVTEDRSVREWVIYTFVNSLGGGIHLATYWWVIQIWPGLVQYPLLPLVVSSAVAAVFNFVVSKKVVFNDNRPG